MAVENWEAELRQQLEGVSARKPRPHSKTWEEVLREMVDNQTPAACKQRRRSSLLPVFVLLMLALLLFIIDHKTGLITKWLSEAKSNASGLTEQVWTKVSRPSPEVVQIKLDLERLRQENKELYDKLLKKIVWDSDRLDLLGGLHNENWLVLENEGAGSKHYLYFNHDWTISGFPQYLELTADEKSFFEKYVKGK